MTALHWAAAFGNHELIKRIVAKGGNPAILMEDGSNAVHNAAYGGHLVTLRHLVEEYGVDPDIADRYGGTPFVWAIQQRHRDIRNYLRARGVVPPSRTKEGWTPLMMAADAGDLEYIRELVEQDNADVNEATNDGQTALFRAAVGQSSEHLDAARYLLRDAKAERPTTTTGWTCLHAAASDGTPEMISLLLDEGFEIEARTADGDTPLGKAVNDNRINSMRKLIDYGAGTNARVSSGDTVLMKAVRLRSEHAVHVLLSEGADVNVPGDLDWTALHHAAADGDGRLLTLLLSQPEIQVNLTTKDGWSALMLAAYYKNEECVRRLLERPDIDGAVTKGGPDALAIAFRSGNTAILERIKTWAKGREEMRASLERLGQLERMQGKHAISGRAQADGQHGLFFETSDEGTLIQAAATGHLAAVRQLITRQVDVAATDWQSRTALHVAAAGGAADIVEFLLKAGARADARDNNGQTPADFADAYGHNAVTHMLIEAGAPEPTLWGAPLVVRPHRSLNLSPWHQGRS